MIAVDTNIIVRHLTRDDPAQAERARQLMIANPVFVSRTVLLELVWVLRSAYGYTREQIATAIDWLLQSDSIEIEHLQDCRRALEAFRAGLDFADALHLAGCPAPRFATFDTDLTRRAAGVFSAPNVITP